MDINVFDTYVEGKNGTMHFDILTEKKDNDVKKAIEYGKKFLKSIGEGTASITAKECRYCHSQGTTLAVENEIKKNGYSIVKMEGCP